MCFMTHSVQTSRVRARVRLCLHLVFHVVGDDDTDKECQSNHTADEHKQVDEYALSLQQHTATATIRSMNQSIDESINR